MDEAGVRASAVDQDVVVLRVTEDDWCELRAVRLAALAEAPMAFGSTMRREQEFDEARWRAWARSAAMFLAVAGESPVGMAAGVAGRSGGERKLVAMWVDPGWRGSGTAAQLMSSVIGWAGAEGADRVTLWVAEGNEAARRLYQSRGFRLTGGRKPLPSNTVQHIDEMALDLSARDRVPGPLTPARPGC
jgi:GNAT superfamily N-acetyltransferase